MSDEDADFCENNFHKPESVKNAGGVSCVSPAPTVADRPRGTSSEPRQRSTFLDRIALLFGFVLLALILGAAYSLAGLVEGVREAYHAMWSPMSDLPVTHTKDPNP
jgi:hypothetical protein